MQFLHESREQRCRRDDECRDDCVACARRTQRGSERIANGDETDRRRQREGQAGGRDRLLRLGDGLPLAVLVGREPSCQPVPARQQGQDAEEYGAEQVVGRGCRREKRRVGAQPGDLAESRVVDGTADVGRGKQTRDASFAQRGIRSSRGGQRTEVED